ncbi:DNA mismatch repair protein Msh6-like isoform X1 [Acropora millepora]|uniref:DNA mismatch repair protein Msh6-like isoform X1 n=1 Tax=Acropora millepora TaxID=45264 RepID=UPI001CF2258B|nr:DNA mismatch repair protein Msh6-like isoform X1 [Acropora millepora]
MATLFSYFNKTPKGKKPPSPVCSEIADKKKSNSPKEGAKGFSPINEDKARVNGKAKRKNEESCSGEIQLYDVVWAKLEGHPWWPSLVCKHPTQDAFQQKGKYHVQFFGEPPSRAWVKINNVKAFIKKLNNNVVDPTIKKAAQQAEDTLSLAREQRNKLVKCLASDEEESPEEEGQSMQLDGESSDKALNSQKRKNAGHDDDDDSDEEVIGRKQNGKRPRRKATLRNSKTKKRRVIQSGSEGDSEDDYKPDDNNDDDDESCSSGVDEKELEDEVLHSEDEIEDNTEKQSRKRKRGKVFTPHQQKTKSCKPSTPCTPVSSGASSVNTPSPSGVLQGTLAKKVSSSASKAAESLARFQMTASPTTSSNVDKEGGEGSYTHERLDWLKEDKRRDKHGRPMSHPEYDPRTLLVPSSFLTSKEVTPAMKQWWQLKVENFDTILFFKVGKFYELYNMDATVGVKELGLIYMKGNFAHAGFPEIAFGRYSDTLIQKGYKVARVEQTETPEMMKERCRKTLSVSRSDQVVKREICAIITKGTKTYSFLDGDCTDSEAAYLLAISEKGSDDSSGGESVYGVCFVDTSIGRFHIGQFQDDRQASRLRTLVAHYTPVQVLCCRGGVTLKTQHVLSHELMSSMKEYLIPGSQFWEASKTLKVLAEEEYFKEDKTSTENSVKSWPEILRKLTDGDPLGLTPADGSELALSALGAVVWYLKKSLIDHEVLSMGNFEEYTPLDSSPNAGRSAAFMKGRQHMILDNVTLTNLDVIPYGPDSSLEGTLLERLDNCSTPFGKRLFKQWLCAPLCNPTAINDRLNAVEDLMANRGLMAECKELLRTLPDLERLLKKIHALSLPKDPNHPAHRAILYNEDTYSKRKINDFLTVLEGFGKAMEIVALFSNHSTSFRSKLLLQVISEERQFPCLKELLLTFKHAFDHNKARNEGVILPKPGVDPDYDGALADINATKGWFDKYLKKQCAALGCKVTYWGSAKNRFQLEVPDSIRKIPDEYTLQSQKKGFKRYWTAEIEDKLAELVNAEERREEALKDTMRHVFHKFDQEYKTWDKAVQCIAVLDSLISLASYSSKCDGPMCRPEIVLPEQTEAGNFQPFFEIRDGRHPCISRTFSGGDFIPNDTVVGIKNDEDCEETAVNSHSTCVLVTGPNMGGKSTLMRQAGLILIMAQMGCFVPAEKCRLTPVDRVFTRLGAQDRILSGESTFFVELNETSTILKHATQHSLVIVDELGRGTATYDGTAIACAVVRALSRQIRCRTLFSTHYHSLVEEFSADENVRLGHMACMVENEDDTDPIKETITFLYKFVKGACPKSYGFNAARLAGIPDEVIALAVKKARQFEESTERIKIFRQLLAKDKYSAQDILSLRERFH